MYFVKSYNKYEKLHAELDNFVEVDEKVRQDLNRKSRVEAIKNKNLQEFEKSFEKVRTSRSPSRQTSPDMSPYKTNSIMKSGLK